MAHERLERDRLEPHRYRYLTDEESELYDNALFSADDHEATCAQFWASQVTALLERIARMRSGDHRNVRH